MISVFNHQRDLKFSKGSVRSLVEEVLSFLKVPYTDVALYFVSKRRISELHQEFFDDPTPTDCISFPMDKEDLGEVFVCPRTAVEYAKMHRVSPYEETALYIIHGLLHLIGYDDRKKDDQRMMRKKEKSCMRHLHSLKMKLSTK